jgi:hypothetical protein
LIVDIRELVYKTIEPKRIFGLGILVETNQKAKISLKDIFSMKLLEFLV